MIKPSIPANEESRLLELSLLDILDTDSEHEFDEITKLASEICNVPISLVTLIDKDRQWFKSTYGIDAKETPRDMAFCAHAINTPNEVFEVYDARLDNRFHDNPFVTNKTPILSYSGVALISSQGNALGTLCVADNKPNKLTDSQKSALQTLSRQVVKSLELRKKNIETKLQNDQLKEKNVVLKDLAHVLSHDLKSPLNNVIGLSEILSNTEGEIEETKHLSVLITKMANNLKLLIDDVIEYAVSENASIEPNNTPVSLPEIVEECISHFNHLDDVEFSVDLKSKSVIGNAVIWKQIIFNLVSNAIQYNDKKQVQISISSSVPNNKKSVQILVKDNGIGIQEQLRDEVFKPFKTLNTKTRNGQKSTGLGLATVSKNINSLNGTIEIETNKPHGTIIRINIPVGLD